MNQRERTVYLRKCDGKRRFTNEDDAEAAIADYEQEDQTKPRPLQVYFCNFCYGLHIGRMPRSRWKSMQRRISYRRGTA